jgi:myo-inositol-1(or 4)-monophosphatase
MEQEKQEAQEMTPSLTACRAVAVAAAEKAGAIIREGFGADHNLRFKKSHSDLVTEFDPRAEAEIVGIIRASFPDHQIVAEEGSTGGQHADYCWYVDPIDGTTNFAHGYPLVCTSIGLEERGELVLGVVYAPILNEIFIGVKGQGATLNGKPIRVSETPRLQRGLLATGFPYDRNTVGMNVDCFDAFLHRAQGVRRDGCAAFDLCNVAMGRFDGFWEYGFAYWDMAAGTVIIREAGGAVTLPDGAPLIGVSHDLVASNGLIHAEIVEVLASVNQHQEEES